MVLRNHYNQAKKNIESYAPAGLSNQAADFHEDGIQELVVQYDMCFNIGGNHVEKYIKVQAFM